MAIRRIAQRAALELRNARGVRPMQAWAAWRRGFYASSIAMYDFAGYGHDAYIPDMLRATRLGHLNRYPYLLDDKFAAYLLLRELGAPTPTVHALVDGGHLTPLGRLPGGRLVVKPRSGSGLGSAAVGGFWSRGRENVLVGGEAAPVEPKSPSNG